jgi:hypothetical protein
MLPVRKLNYCVADERMRRNLIILDVMKSFDIELLKPKGGQLDSMLFKNPYLNIPETFILFNPGRY